VLPAVTQINVTSQVTVTYYGTQYNRTTHTTSFWGTITNNSNQPIQGPIWLSFLSLLPTTVTANQKTGTLNGSAYFDITALAGSDGVLSPGETTAARSFSLANPNSASISFQTLVLGVVQAVAPPPAIQIFLDFDGGTLSAPAGVALVPGAPAVTHAGFVPFPGATREDEIERIVQAVRADFAPYPVQVLRDDNWQVNPVFGAGDTAILVGGDGSWLVGVNPIFGGGSVAWTAGEAAFDPANLQADVAFAFSAATAQALAFLGRPEPEYVQQLANSISHEVGHTFGLAHVSALNGALDLMGTAANGTPVNGDGVFSSVVLPRENGLSYSSDGYLRSVFGLSLTPLPFQAGGGAMPEMFEISGTPHSADAGTKAPLMDFAERRRVHAASIDGSPIIEGGARPAVSPAVNGRQATDTAALAPRPLPTLIVNPVWTSTPVDIKPPSTAAGWLDPGAAALIPGVVRDRLAPTMPSLPVHIDRAVVAAYHAAVPIKKDPHQQALESWLTEDAVSCDALVAAACLAAGSCLVTDEKHLDVERARPDRNAAGK